MEACNYALATSHREENRSSEPYVYAFLSIGGPWLPGMESDPDEYRKVGGDAGAVNVSPSEFGAAEKEILAAGAMCVTIRRVTMPPGSRIVAIDRYPTLRMAEKGHLEFASSKAGSDPTAQPDVLALKSRFGWMGWDSLHPRTTVSNTGKEPAEFIEWSVAPAQGATH